MKKLTILCLSIYFISMGYFSSPAFSAAKPTTENNLVEACPTLLTNYKESGKNPELVIFYGSDYLKTFPIQKIDDALSFYFAEKKPEQPMLLYLHGRALKDTNIGDYDREPNESKKDVVPELSSKFHAKTVLMLHWPHKKIDEKGFPEENAKFAGNALICVIQRLNSDNFNNNKFPGFRALITHSMGSLVLEDALKNSSENLHEFNVVAISASASRANGSSIWLSKIQAEKQYVLINTSDVVLKQVKTRMDFTPLGMCNSNCFKENKPINTVTYLDITEVAGFFGARHDYFVKGNVADKIMTKILKGEQPPQGTKGISENIRIIRDRDL